ncbi:hypothetical protein UlMin_004464 [Ulmus minor]
MEAATALRLVLQILLLIMREFVCSSTGAPHHHLVSCLESAKEALLDFKTGLDDPENQLFSWKGNNCCRWVGIRCDNTTGAVSAINLHCSDPDNGSKLGGRIRPSITKLKSLTHVDFSFCSFDDIPIPEFFGSFENLKYLNLSKAGFRGTIPSNLGNLSTLQYLDVGSISSSSLVVDNFEWVAGLVSLKHLAMNRVNISIVGLDWIRILNRLPFLTELHMSSCGLSGPLPSHTFLNFTSLAVLDLSGNLFNSKIPDSLANVSSMVDVDMSDSSLYGRIPLGLAELPNLEFLSLYRNFNLTASCSQLFKGKWERIQVLDLSINKVHGKIPASIGNMKFLTYLDLSVNDVEGGIPSAIGKLCNLEFVDITSNKLDGTLPEFLRGTRNCLSNLKILHLFNNQLGGELPEWFGELESLVSLNLESNLLHGPIPASLGSLQNLVDLSLSWNKLNGTLPHSLGQLSKLSTFDVSSNNLTGLVTETHFQKLGKLKSLDLSSNSFTLNINSNWVPPFQLEGLGMGSCHFGTSFPTWFKSQKKVTYLDFSNAGISGFIPDWFWEISSNLHSLNISFNKLEGQLPSAFNIGYLADVDFSSNLFVGSVPYPINFIMLLDLSNNKFFGPIPENLSQSVPPLSFLFLSNNQINGEIPASIFSKSSTLSVIVFSNNNLTGRIPSNIGNCTSLRVIDLSNNNLSGKIPVLLGQLSSLEILQLSDNKLSGEIPQTFSNLSSLGTLDLGENKLTGEIPQWIGEGFETLKILNLRTNSFFGELPASLSNLSSLQVLDVTENQLNGSIPASSGDFKAMTKVQRNITSVNLGRGGRYYEEKLVVTTKGQVLTFTKTLSLVVSLQLSENNLSGEIPPELTKLLGLLVLNLSGNHISGAIPESISMLKQLQSLDFSSNRLSGPIPQSMPSLSFLQYLNLSNNDFSGTIPFKDQMTTFEASSFAGNPRLCGAPLVLTCHVDDNNGNSSKGWKSSDLNDNNFVDTWFFLSIGLGFAAGLLVPFFLMTIITSWSDAYFGLVNNVFERIALFTYRMRRAMP